MRVRSDLNYLKAAKLLWVLDEQQHADDHDWVQPLPSMITERYKSSAISVGYHLFVAGRHGGTKSHPLASVEVYDGCKWGYV